MTQEQRDLLNAVLASPNDDLPRLVYADWLDEHDEPTPCGCDDGVIDTGGFDPAGNPVYVECGICDGVGHLPNQNALRAALIRTQCTISGVRWDCERKSWFKNCQDWNRFVRQWEPPILCPTCKTLQELKGEEDRIRRQLLDSGFWKLSIDNAWVLDTPTHRGFIERISAPLDWLQKYLHVFVQYHPVQMVQAPGCSPYQLYDGHCGWQSEAEFGRWDYIPATVMKAMVDLGIGHPESDTPNGFRVRIFPDRDAAYMGLSATLLHMAREKAGMVQPAIQTCSI